MKKNTLDQLLTAFFKVLSLCVKSNANGSTAVSNYQNFHSINIFSLQTIRLSQVSSFLHEAKLMGYSINLSPRTQ
jgi:hypothetical protein